jgi:hypothetical protein
MKKTTPRFLPFIMENINGVNSPKKQMLRIFALFTAVVPDKIPTPPSPERVPQIQREGAENYRLTLGAW